MTTTNNYFAMYPEDGRLTTLPIMRPDIWDFYTKATMAFWIPSEVCMKDDARDFEQKLSPDEQFFVKQILAFFAASDAIVNINIIERFKKDIPILEVGYFYDFQVSMENIHAHMYSILLNSIITNVEERNRLLNSISTMPIIQRITDYIFQCIDSAAPLPERLLRMACVEGIFFTGCFTVIFWLVNRGIMPGLGHSNELISIDEGLHTEFSLYLYGLVVPEHKLTREQIVKVFTGAVSVAQAFIKESLPVNLPEMNSDLICQYIESQADNLLALIDQDPIYGTKSNIHYMKQINLRNKTNYHERRVSDYAKSRIADDKTVSYDF